MTFEKVRLYLNLKTTESAQHIRNIRYSFKRQETWCNISSYREWYLYDDRQVSYSTLFIGSLLCSQPKNLWNTCLIKLVGVSGSLNV